jgi:hypothetical protein
VLLYLRLNKGWTQAMVRRRYGRGSHTYFSRIENIGRCPESFNMEAISDAYGSDLPHVLKMCEYLMGGV